AHSGVHESSALGARATAQETAAQAKSSAAGAGACRSNRNCASHAGASFSGGRTTAFCVVCIAAELKKNGVQHHDDFRTNPDRAEGAKQGHCDEAEWLPR